jgi:hypothetical protein
MNHVGYFINLDMSNISEEFTFPTFMYLVITNQLISL